MKLEAKQLLAEKVSNGICHSFNEHSIPPDVGVCALASTLIESVIELGWDKEDVFEIVDFLYDKISTSKNYLR